MAENMRFVLDGDDRLTPTLNRAGDSAQRLHRRIDDASMGSSASLARFTRDANGRLRDLRGRFLSAGEAAQLMRSGIAPLPGGLGGVASAGSEAGAALGKSGGGLGGVMAGVAAVAGLSLLPALGALVPMMAGAGLAAVTLKLGFAGVGEAAALASEDKKEYAKALKKLSPEARGFTKELVGLKQQFGGIGKEIQKALLPGFTQALKDAGPVVKILGRAMTEMGEGFGEAARGVGRLMKDSGFQRDFTATLKLGSGFVQELTSSMGPFIRSLLAFGAASGPTLKAFSDGISGLLAKGLPGMFKGLEVGIGGSAKFLGGLFAMINKVLPAIGRFAGETARAFGPLLGELAEAAGDRLAAVLDTVGAGLKALSPVFKDLAFGVKSATQVFRIIAPTIKDTAGAIIGALLPSFSEIDKARGPLQRLSGWISDNKILIQEGARIFGSAIIGMVTAVVANLPNVIRMFRLMSTGIVTALGGILHGAASAFGWIPGIGPKLRTADREFGKFKDAFISGLVKAEDTARKFSEKTVPRLEKNNLKMNISNWQTQIKEAKRLLSDKNLPPKKRAKLLATKKDLERKVAGAQRDLTSIKDKTARIKGDKRNFDGKVSAVKRKKMPTKTSKIKGDPGNFWSKVRSIAGRVVGSAVINLLPGGSLLAKLGLRDGGLVGFPNGGVVRGPGTGTSDSILARLSNGEFVIRAAAVQRVGVEFLQALNEGKLGPARPAAARTVTGRAAGTAATFVNITVNGALDPVATAQQLERVLAKFQRTNGGKRLAVRTA